MRQKLIDFLTGKTRKETRVLLVSSNIWYWGEGMFGPLLAVFTRKIGGNILDIAWAWAIYLLTTGVLTIIVGRLSDGKLKKRHIVVIGYFLNAVFTFGYLLIEVPFHLFLVQIGLGMASALAAPTWDALFSRYSTKDQTGYEWGLAGGQAQIYTALGIILGGIIVQYHGYKVLFIIMGIVQTIAAFSQLMFLKYPSVPVNESTLNEKI